MKIRNKKLAREKIIEYLNSVDTKIYPSELSEILNIDYGICISVIVDLKNEEKVEYDD